MASSPLAPLQPDPAPTPSAADGYLARSRTVSFASDTAFAGDGSDHNRRASAEDTLGPASSDDRLQTDMPADSEITSAAAATDDQDQPATIPRFSRARRNFRSHFSMPPPPMPSLSSTLSPPLIALAEPSTPRLSLEASASKLGPPSQSADHQPALLPRVSALGASTPSTFSLPASRRASFSPFALAASGYDLDSREELVKSIPLFRTVAFLTESSAFYKELSNVGIR
ncbi:hypothetical protein HK405_013295 [Cladochytrium tenue]|nr:hypothetical protein HK405_013295 [Cladochytrium tenue]